MEEIIPSDFAPFHTPGHKGNWDTPGSGIPPGGFDIADDLHGFPGKIRESEEWAATVYGTRRVFYLVNGSTAGIHAMFTGIFKPGDVVIAGRNFHRSAAAAMVFSGVVPEYIPVSCHRGGPALNVTPTEVKKALDNYPECRALYITSPSYHGVCADVKEIARLCHERDKLLLVDEAWGAHFPFHHDLPKSAIGTGADLVVQSLHKTLPSLTGTAILHICSDRVDMDKIHSALKMNETTSPNMLDYISIEQAISTMAERGEEILSKAIKRASKCRDLVSNFAAPLVNQTEFLRDGPEPGFSVDPVKLTLFTLPEITGITGIEAARIIEEKYRVVPEMADLLSVLFLFTGWEREDHVNRLYNSLESLLKIKFEKQSESHPENVLLSSGAVHANMHFPQTIPKRAMTPREAYFSPVEFIPISQSSGRVSGEIITPYPPGVPLLIPGEIITGETIRYIQAIQKSNGSVRGVKNMEREAEIPVLII